MQEHQSNKRISLIETPPGVSWQFYASLVTAVIVYLSAQFEFLPKRYALGLLLAHGLFWVFLERRYRAVNTAFGKMLERPNRTVWALLIAAAILTTYYFAPGYMFRGDGVLRVSKTHLFMEAVRGGEWPMWSFSWYCGFPFLLFDPPLTYYLTGIVAVLTGDANLACKIVMWLAHIASTGTAFLLLRRLLGKTGPAYAGALCYALTFWHGASVVFVGQFQMAIFYTLLPLPFWIGERYLAGEAGWLKSSLALGLVMAAMLHAHLAYAYWTVIVITLWFALRILMRCGDLFKTILRFAGFGIAGGLVMAVLCAGFLIPIKAESHYTNSIAGHLEKSEDDAADSPNNRVPVMDLVKWSREWQGFGHGTYLGLSILALAGLGVIAGLMQNRALGVPAAVLWVFSMWLVLDLPGREHIPIVQAMPAWRYLLYLVFFMLPVAGLGAGVLSNRLGERKAAILITVVLLLDLGRTTFVRAFLPTMFGKRQQTYDSIPRGNGRVLDLREDDNPDTLWPAAFPMAGLRTPFGGYPEDSTTLYYHQAAVARRAAYEYYEQGGDISKKTLHQLRMMDVNYVVVWWDSSTVTLQIDRTNNVILLVVPDRSGKLTFDPVPPMADIYASRTPPSETCPIEVVKDVLLINTLYRENRLDTTAVDAAIAEELASPSVVVDVTGFVETQTTLRFTLTAPQECYVRIPYAWYPTLKMTLDGQPWEMRRMSLGYIYFRMPEGEHEVRIQAGISGLRKICLIVSALALLLVVLGLTLSPKASAGARSQSVSA